MTTLTIRLDNELKSKIEKLTDDLWISLNQLVNLKLREFTQTWEIHINAYKNNNMINLNEPAEKVYDYLDNIIKNNGKEWTDPIKVEWNKKTLYFFCISIY